MKVAIVGSGEIAKVHGPVILRATGAKLVGVADRDLSRAKATAAELKSDHYYQDAEQMIEEQKPDIVHILTPPASHAPLSIMAMNKGCNVLVEKPMALTMTDAKKMIAAAKRNGVILCVNHNMVFYKVVQEAIKLVSKGEIGKLVSVEANFLFDARRYPAIMVDGAELSHWTYLLKGGPPQDLMPHAASLVFEFIKDITEVHTIGQNRGVLPNAWQDEVRVLINSSDIMGYINISYSEKPDVVTLTLKGTKGTITSDLFNDILTIRKKSDLPRAAARGLSGFQLAYQFFKGSIANIYNFAAGRVDATAGVEPLVTKLYKAIRDEGETPITVEKSLGVVDLMNKVWPRPSVNIEKIRSSVDSIINKPETPTALVTGASGFVGTHIVRKLLSENIGVRALVRPNSIHAGRLKKASVEVVEGDLSDPDVIQEAARGIKMVYHAGADMSSSWKDQERATLEGTRNLIKASLNHGVKRFVHLSTLAVYELLEINNKTIKENSPYQKYPKQMGPYAYFKIEAEKIVLGAFKKDGLGVSIVRPGMIIGPLGGVFFPHFGYRLGDTKFLLIGKGDVPLPFTYVENTVEGIFKASIEKKAIGQIYNLIDDGQITARKYLERFIKVTGVDGKIISLPYFIPYSATAAYEFVSSLGLLKKGITSRAQLKWKQAPVLFDSQKAREELGWKEKMSIEEGLDKTFTWYRENFVD
jgi:predicted dehydrogenase/nucleoside-diphosphate-sugar epimerase